ncbi:MAG: hypothetical protein IKH26_11810, partial [Bacteroidaceae bacterium]|nr:hypothetical protein [Bacteroidaceae bacterium]
LVMRPAMERAGTALSRLSYTWLRKPGHYGSENQRTKHPTPPCRHPIPEQARPFPSKLAYP